MKSMKNTSIFIIALSSFTLGLGAGSGGSPSKLFAYVSVYAVSYVIGEIIGSRTRDG